MYVSMESGLEDRNNLPLRRHPLCRRDLVSMESGLEDRNNEARPAHARRAADVSMESGLEDRNNRPREERPLSMQEMSQWSPA